MAQARKIALRVVKSPAPVYQLRVELQHIKPAIWRQILVPGSIKLSKLHVVLLLAMGWDGGHVHEFIMGDTHYGDPFPDWPSDPPMLNETKVTLTKALGGLKSFTYIYDYGDNWQHKVKVEKAVSVDLGLSSPLCLAGGRACPPEDVGGAPGYSEFLEAIKDPTHEEHQQMIAWCGGSFDPDAFDLDAVSQRLWQIKL